MHLSFSPRSNLARHSQDGTPTRFTMAGHNVNSITGYSESEPLIEMKSGDNQKNYQTSYPISYIFSYAGISQQCPKSFCTGGRISLNKYNLWSILFIEFRKFLLSNPRLIEVIHLPNMTSRVLMYRNLILCRELKRIIHVYLPLIQFRFRARQSCLVKDA